MAKRQQLARGAQRIAAHNSDPAHHFDRIALGTLGELSKDRPVVGIHALWTTLACRQEPRPTIRDSVLAAFSVGP
jgi:hypothetical protein